MNFNGMTKISGNPSDSYVTSLNRTERSTLELPNAAVNMSQISHLY